jgi:site-specific recombinase XerD
MSKVKVEQSRIKNPYNRYTMCLLHNQHDFYSLVLMRRQSFHLVQFYANAIHQNYLGRNSIYPWTIYFLWVMIRTYSECAALPVDAHPYMLRHACGCALADQDADTRLMQDYLGHWNIQHTVMYTVTNPARFERL